MGDLKEQFSEIVAARNYQDQAIWFMNGFWEDIKGDCNKIWDITQKFIELDEANGAAGKELNEFDSHRLLESYDETLSVIKMREALREIDQDANGKMAALEYFIWKYGKTVAATVTAPQGDNAAAVAAAEALLKEVQTALEAVLAKQEETKAAIAASEAAIAELAQKEQELVAAEAEAKAAVDELKAQEDAYNAKIAALEAKSTDTSIGIVTRNKAAAELSQLKAEDPLPLRKAKITQEAAVRLVQKAQAATAAAKEDAQAKKAALEEVQAQLEASEQELQGKLAEAEAELTKAKQSGGDAHGNFYFMERALFEADKSLARARQKYDHSKPFEYQG